MFLYTKKITQKNGKDKSIKSLSVTEILHELGVPQDSIESLQQLSKSSNTPICACLIASINRGVKKI